MQSIVQLPNGSIAQVNVYRDDRGDVVIVGMAKHVTPAGVSETVVSSRMTPAVFEHYRQKAIDTMGILAYQRLLARAGISDDVRRAPLLPRGGLPMLSR